MTKEIPISSITENIMLTVEVTGLRCWAFKRKLAFKLIQFAAWIMGVQIKIKVNIEDGGRLK